ncbi:MAG: hypothetical protein FWC41_13120 [Firmicutes bacterium]|nr:hypothetical protein [Bacillota bacterium]
MKKKINFSVAEQIREVCDELAKTDLWFNMESDSDLIESCIYKRFSLNARFRHLINKAKRESTQDNGLLS